MRWIRQALAALAAPALILGLAACTGTPEAPPEPEPALETSEKLAETSDGGGDPDSDTQEETVEETAEGTAEETTAPADETGAPPADPDDSANPDNAESPDNSEQPTNEPGDEQSDSPSDEQSDEPSDEPSEGPSHGGSAGDGGDTVIAGIWVDESWEITERQHDVCEFSLSASPYSESEHVFMCGANAEGAVACALEEGESVVCLTDVLDKRALRFQSPTAAAQQGQAPESEQQTIPLIAELPDGAICTAAAHDHGQHYDGMFSWYSCSDGSELLTPDEIGATFERGEPWTVQRSVSGGAPVTTAVTTATFADPQV